MHYLCGNIKKENQLDLAIIKKESLDVPSNMQEYWKGTMQNWYKNCKLNISLIFYI